jgi:hypothetical protein
MPISNNSVYIIFNAIAVLTAYVMLSLSIWMATVDISTKGYWGMGVFLLTCALVNLVKYRLDDRMQQERLYKLETAKNEKIIQDYITE